MKHNTKFLLIGVLIALLNASIYCLDDVPDPLNSVFFPDSTEVYKTADDVFKIEVILRDSDNIDIAIVEGDDLFNSLKCLIDNDEEMYKHVDHDGKFVCAMPMCQAFKIGEVSVSLKYEDTILKQYQVDVTPGLFDPSRIVNETDAGTTYPTIDGKSVLVHYIGAGRALTYNMTFYDRYGNHITVTEGSYIHTNVSCVTGDKIASNIVVDGLLSCYFEEPMWIAGNHTTLVKYDNGVDVRTVDTYYYRTYPKFEFDISKSDFTLSHPLYYHPMDIRIKGNPFRDSYCNDFDVPAENTFFNFARIKLKKGSSVISNYGAIYVDDKDTFTVTTPGVHSGVYLELCDHLYRCKNTATFDIKRFTI